MLDKLQSLEEKYEELSELLSQPDTVSDLTRYQRLTKALSDLTDIVNTYREYKQVLTDIKEAESLLREELESDFRDLVEQEFEESQQRKADLEKSLQMLLLPKDPNDDKSVIMEIRAGTGGEEAALFAATLFRMYCRYAEKQGWKTDVMDTSYSDLNGFKEIVFVVEGKGAYSRLKYESGVHRVQRIPVTESGGRIHTSAATVAVLPEAEEVEVEINPNDVRIDLYCSSGPGGQSVNTTQSAVRLTHIPSGLVVTCQDEKSQHKNKDKAMRVLRARLLEITRAEKDAEIADTRRGMVGSGDRSERIRTYNYPQGRVTDHRIGLTLHKLDAVLEGDLEEIINGLVTHDQTEKLKQVN
ncbi:MAG: peptide chain release factor 1 [Syntrophomonadales bacterium]|jgi:peptide chain release factor 1